LAQRVHGAIGIELGNVVELRIKAALQEEIREALDKLLEVNGISGLAGVAFVADVFQGATSLPLTLS